jgi:hypothetical protein
MTVFGMGRELPIFGKLVGHVAVEPSEQELGVLAEVVVVVEALVGLVDPVEFFGGRGEEWI